MARLAATNPKYPQLEAITRQIRHTLHDPTWTLARPTTITPHDVAGLYALLSGIPDEMPTKKTCNAVAHPTCFWATLQRPEFSCLCPTKPRHD